MQMLNPHCVMHAVHRIINAKKLAKNHGALSLDALDDIFAQSKKDHCHHLPEKHTCIVNSMKKFELCCKLAPNHILVPDLLKVTQPLFAFPEEDILHFCFKCNFLPHSGMPHFIVNEHQDIEGELHWRTDVVPQDRKTGAWAVVKADVRDHKVSIEVTGDREHFTSTSWTFCLIHDSFHKLIVTQKVPLANHPECVLDCDDLLFHKEQGQKTVLISKVHKPHSVDELLLRWWRSWDCFCANPPVSCVPAGVGPPSPTKITLTSLRGCFSSPMPMDQSTMAK